MQGQDRGVDRQSGVDRQDSVDRQNSADTDASAGPTRLVIVGGGFAGVWAAIGAADLRAARGLGEDDIEIVLVSPRDVLVIRPRLYESDPATKTLELRLLLDPIGVAHIPASVGGISTDTRTVTLVDVDANVRVLGYDRLILASGSRLIEPPFDRSHVHDIDTIEAANELDQHLQTLDDDSCVVVVGSGFTGIELASELVTRVPTAHIVLVEREPVVGPRLGDSPRAVVLEAIDELGIEVRTGVELSGYDGTVAQMSDGSTIAADTVVWTGGMEASQLTSDIPARRDVLGRLEVDQKLRVTGVPHVFAAGDTAAPLDESGHVVAQSCQHAIPQGACAGRNAIADLLGLELNELETKPYQTCLDLGKAGAVYSQGWEQHVRMVKHEAKELKQEINTIWIYPPVSSAIS